MENKENNLLKSFLSYFLMGFELSYIGISPFRIDKNEAFHCLRSSFVVL